MLRGRRESDLIARAVAYQLLTDLEPKVLVLAERQDGSGRSLEVQRMLEPDEGDEDDLLPCFVVDAGPTYFGAPLSWRVVKSREINLQSDANEVFGVSVLRVRLGDEAVARMVEAALSHLLDDGPEPAEFAANGWAPQPAAIGRAPDGRNARLAECLC